MYIPPKTICLQNPLQDPNIKKYRVKAGMPVKEAVKTMLEEIEV